MSWNTTLLKRSARLATSIGTVVLAALALGGCVGSKRQSRRCEWPTETPRRLDLAQSADRAHLHRDCREFPSWQLAFELSGRAPAMAASRCVALHQLRRPLSADSLGPFPSLPRTR